MADDDNKYTTKVEVHLERVAGNGKGFIRINGQDVRVRGLKVTADIDSITTIGRRG